MYPELVLASASLRRKRILTEANIKFTTFSPNIDETDDDKLTPEEIVNENAVEKARAASKAMNKSLILSADTIVVFNERIIGKPLTLYEARAILSSYAGKSLSVYTGICLWDTTKDKHVTKTVQSKVTVKSLSYEDIDELLRYLDPCDRAGGFSIEGIGSCFFDCVEGSFYNILGLPMNALYDLFEELGLSLLNYIAHENV